MSRYFVAIGTDYGDIFKPKCHMIMVTLAFDVTITHSVQTWYKSTTFNNTSAISRDSQFYWWRKP